MIDFEKGCDLCNNPTVAFSVRAKGLLNEGALKEVEFECNSFDPPFCPYCGRGLRNNNDVTTKGE